MDNLNYNASHAPDPTAREAIMAADEMPVKISDTIKRHQDLAENE